MRPTYIRFTILSMVILHIHPALKIGRDEATAEVVSAVHILEFGVQFVAEYMFPLFAAYLAINYLSVILRSSPDNL